MASLDIIIPSRNEQFLRNTVEDILKNIRGDTRIIVVLDGAWAEPQLVQHERVTVIHHSESIGQRAAANEAARLSRAKYLMKCDAHCAFSEGFDVQLMADMQDDWTTVPVMRNLHVFDWICPEGHRRYQSASGPCTVCGKPTKMDIVWIAKANPQSTSYCFDSTPHFQYNGEYTKREESKNGIVIGYELSFEIGMISPEIVVMLTNFARSHKLSSGQYSLWGGENVTVNTVGFTPIDNGGGFGVGEVNIIRNEPKVNGVTATSIFTDVVNDRNTLSPSFGDGANEPSIGNSMGKLFFSEIGAAAITTFISSAYPIPTSTRLINSDVIHKLCDILGGEFIYSEKTRSFHNRSVSLKTIHDKNLTESMSLQGSCFMLTREKWFELNICDESFGSWGSQGIEISAKTHLSGGKVIVNHRTWYAHLFRTSGGDFSFPYHLSGKQVEHAKNRARELFFTNSWPKQIHPLSWLVEKFWPVKGWSDEDLVKLKENENPTKATIKPFSIVYYTDNRLDERVSTAVQSQLNSINAEIISVSLKPICFGKNIVLNYERGYLTMFRQILAGIEASQSEIIFFAEHDVLYSPSHFEFRPPDRTKIWYNLNVWQLRSTDGHLVYWDAKRTSQLCAYRDVLLEHYRKRVERVEKDGFSRRIGFEPASHHRPERIDDLESDTWKSAFPNVDIKHGQNLTEARWSTDQFRSKRSCKNWAETDSLDGWDLQLLKDMNGNQSPCK